MKVLLDIKDNKAAFLMELLNSLPYVKTKPITPAKSLLVEELKEAFVNLKKIKQGKLKAKSLKDLLDEI